MALIKCGECGREISDKAATCPGCGAPIAAPAANAGRACPRCKKPMTGSRTIKVTPGGVTALGVILILFGVCGLPFMGLGTIGIVLGIVLMVVIKEQRTVNYCVPCSTGSSATPPTSNENLAGV